MSIKKVALELAHAEFDRSRLRVYYGNIGEIIAQETLRRQGFEVLLTRPVGIEKDFLRILHLPKMNEEIKELRRYYNNLPSFRKEEEPWKEFLVRHKERIKSEIEIAKLNRAFFGESIYIFCRKWSNPKFYSHPKIQVEIRWREKIAGIVPVDRINY